MLRRLDIDGTQEHCFDEGTSRRGTVFLLHGFPDVPTTFDALAEELVARGYRVIRPYLPGYAPSSYAGPFDVASLCERLLRLLDLLGLEPCHLIGHDWGAVLSYALLRRAPERFLTGTCLSVPHPLHLLRGAIQAPTRIRRGLYMLAMQPRGWGERWLCNGDRGLVAQLWRSWSPGFPLDLETRHEIEERLIASGSRPFEYYRRLPASFATRPSPFGAIAPPFLYLHGRDDGCMHWSFAQGQERYFKGPHRQHTLDCVGHFLQAEAPREVALRFDRWAQDATIAP